MNIHKKCWNKHIIVLDKCINNDNQFCYKTFKQNYNKCIKHKLKSLKLHFNKIVSTKM
jgi:hypothetical protein